MNICTLFPPDEYGEMKLHYDKYSLGLFKDRNCGVCVL